MNKKFIAITIGDINGIGIELLTKLFIEKKIRNFILFTNFKLFNDYLKKNKLGIKVQNIKKLNILINKSNVFYIYDFKAKNNSENSFKSLKESYKYTKKFNLKGIINLPINKEKIIKDINKKFIGQTVYYQQIDKKNVSNMIFIYNNLIITTLTTHIKLNSVSNKLSKKNYIYNKIINLNNVLIKYFKIKNQK